MDLFPYGNFKNIVYIISVPTSKEKKKTSGASLTVMYFLVKNFKVIEYTDWS